MAPPANAALASANPPLHPQPTVRALFYVMGASDPGLLPRLIEPVAKLGHVPTRVHASRESGDGSELSVDLRLNGVSPRAAQLVETALRSVVGVRQVLSVVEPER
jgi:acetolactate synthase regulatory subunit